MITFQLPRQSSLERCLVFYQSTEKVNVYDDMLELWFTQDAPCACSMVYVLYLLHLLFFFCTL